MTLQTSYIYFSQDHIDKVFTSLTSIDKEFKVRFDKYLFEEYKGDISDRLHYLDISEIARFLVEKSKSGQTTFFHDFFNQVEFILTNCDSYVDNLIVVGLFEGIQNIGSKEIDYYQGFDKWLKPTSKLKWDKLIDFWEGDSWRRAN